ncbi:MAG: tRNA-intron lyase [Methanocorpusculum sp.]|nr:tRNA-intron lyase [Methanocorpusculum sp.]
MKAKFDGTYVYAPEEAIQFNEQSGYGRIEKDGRLRLDAKEALYLNARGKLEIEGYDFDKLLAECSKTPGFLRNFVVYRDIRERGYVITTGPQDFRIFPRGQKPGKGQSRYLMRVISERDLIDFSSIISDAKASANMRKQFILAVLDDEHELTYYEIRFSQRSPAEKKEIPSVKAVLAGIPSFVAEDGSGITENLKKLWFGTMLDSTRLFLSPIETAWLIKQGLLTLSPETNFEEYVTLASSSDADFSEKLVLYSYLKELGFYPRSGYKYGHHFRVYTQDGQHSEMLAHAIPTGTRLPMSEVSRSVRLSHSVKKKMLFACVNGKEITEIEFARIKM